MDDRLTFDDEVKLKYPSPLALTYNRMDSADELSAKHSLLGDLFEVILKYYGTILIGQYLRDKKTDRNINKELQNLEKSSIGHWVGFIRVILKDYEKEELIFPKLHSYYNQKSNDLKASMDLCRYFSKENNKKIAIRDMFDLLTNYRNNTKGHGGTAKISKYKEIISYLQPALEEILKEMDFICKLPLVYIKQVKYREKACEHVIAILKALPKNSKYTCSESEHLEAERLYLFSESCEELTPLFTIHPLMIYHSCDSCKQEQVLFLNKASKNKLEYLDYQCGQITTITEFSEKKSYINDYKEMMFTLKADVDDIEQWPIWQGDIENLKEKVEIEEIKKEHKDMKKTDDVIHRTAIQINSKEIITSLKSNEKKLEKDEKITEKKAKKKILQEETVNINKSLNKKSILIFTILGLAIALLLFLKSPLIFSYFNYNHALSLAKEKKYGEALKYLDKALESNPDSGELLYEKGEILSLQGNYKESVNFYDKALNSDKEHARALLAKGVALYLMNDKNQSFKCFDDFCTLSEAKLKYFDVNSKDNDGWTPLHYAAYIGHEGLAGVFMSSGADINVRDNEKKTPLHLASSQGNKPLARLLIEKKAEINAEDLSGFTPLHLAKTKDMAELLLSSGGNVNSRDGQGQTPLYNPNKELVEFLISRGAEINIKDNLGRTPLHNSVYKGYKEVAHLLITKGADINIKDNTGETPLHLAVNNRDIVEFLVLKGADVNSEDDRGRTPLHLAVIGGDIKTVEFLISHKAKVNLKDDLEETPLHIAVKEGRKDIVEVLLEAGADKNLKDKDGITPLKLAEKNNNKEIMEIFKKL